MTIEVGCIFTNTQGCKAKVIKKKGQGNFLMEYQDDEKYRRIYPYKALSTGNFWNPYHKSYYGVGYIGAGKYRSSINNEMQRSFIVWQGILQRCYGDIPKARSNNSQDTFTVCDEWHNYQNFADWYVSHVFDISDFDVSVSVMKSGNKHYCPEYCELLPPSVISLFSYPKKTRGAYPVGVHFLKKSSLYIARLSVEGDRFYLGAYRSAEEAALVYKRAKEKHVNSKAEEWSGKISQRAYDMLSQWRVEESETA